MFAADALRRSTGANGDGDRASCGLHGRAPDILAAGRWREQALATAASNGLLSRVNIIRSRLVRHFGARRGGPARHYRREPSGDARSVELGFPRNGGRRAGGGAAPGKNDDRCRVVVGVAVVCRELRRWPCASRHDRRILRLSDLLARFSDRLSWHGPSGCGSAGERPPPPRRWARA